jgi:BlaI family penicillinase repressor
MSIRIADSELEVMRILWREGRPLSFAEIRKELESKTEWSKSTIQTFVVRLRDKGILSTLQPHNVTLYSPTVTEQEYLQSEEQNFLDKLFDGSAKKLVAALCQNGKLTEDDVDELKAFFEIGGEEK